MMLDAFHDRVGAERFEVPEARGLTFYQVLTLASIVEREAVLDDERPLIAGVYQNRIDRETNVAHGLLQADPTVLYAVDTVKLGSPATGAVLFWTVPEAPPQTSRCPGDLAGYNTYMVGGLPPGPICTPWSPRSMRRSRPTPQAGYTSSSRSRRATGGTTSQDARGARAERPRVRLQAGDRPATCLPAPADFAAPPDAATRARWRDAERAASPGPRSRACASGWRARASTPTSAPRASTCAG